MDLEHRLRYRFFRYGCLIFNRCGYGSRFGFFHSLFFFNNLFVLCFCFSILFFLQFRRHKKRSFQESCRFFFFRFYVRISLCKSFFQLLHALCLTLFSSLSTLLYTEFFTQITLRLPFHIHIMAVLCKCTDTIPDTEHKSEKGFLRDQNQRNEQNQNYDHIAPCHAKCRSCRNADCSAKHTSACPVQRTDRIIFSHRRTGHISFGQKLDQSTQKNKEYDCCKYLLISKRILLI